MSVSPLVTRGFGSSPKIVTIGFGGIPAPAPPAPTPSVVIIDHNGGASFRSKRDYHPQAKKPWIDTFKIEATLYSVNGEILDNQVTEKMDAIYEDNESFTITASTNVEVTKTMPKSNIIIKVLKLFKRR